MSLDVETIREELDVFGVDSPAPADEIWDKVLIVCKTNGWDEVQFTEEWVAYCARLKSTDQTPIDDKNMLAFEVDVSKALKNKMMKQSATAVKSRPKPSGLVGIPLEIENVFFFDNGVSMLSMYVDKDSLPAAQTRPALRQMNVDERQSTGALPVVTGLLSAEAFAPMDDASTSAEPSKFSQRDRRGQAVSEFVGAKYSSALSALEATDNQDDCKTRITPLVHFTEDGFKYMYQKFVNVSEVRSDQIDHYADWVLKSADDKVDEFDPIKDMTADVSYVVGQMTSDSETKLYPTGAILEGSLNDMEGASVALDFSNCAQFSLYSGQLCAFKGTNPSGKSFVVEKEIKPSLIRCANIESDEMVNDLHIMVTAGPYTVSENFSFEPLYELVSVCARRKNVDALIMLGPLVDERHERVAAAQLDCTPDQMLQRIITNVCRNLEGVSTQVIYCSSVDDVNSVGVYPTPAFDVPHSWPAHVRQRCTFVCNPSMIRIGGVTFGMTSEDVLQWLAASEVAHQPAESDRMTRLCEHVLRRRCLMPLYPAPGTLAVDWMAFGRYASGHTWRQTRPHILILPSNLHPFVKTIDGSLCVNAGRCARSSSSGTYCSIQVQVANARKQGENAKMADHCKAVITRL